MRNSRLLTIFFIVFVDLLGFGLILPLLPYYAESYGATATIVGLLVASYAAAQLIGAPLLGRLSDRYGRRPILLISVGGTLLGFLLLGFADPLGRAFSEALGIQSVNNSVIGVLFLSRILDGLTGGNITVAQAYISDISDEKDRAKSLGIVGAAFGLGFIIGPATGGLLSQWNLNFPAYAAAVVSLLNIFFIYFFLPESLVGEMREAARERQRTPFTIKAMVEALNRPGVGPLLHLRFFYGLAFSTFTSIFALFAQAIGLNSQTTGYLLAYVGLVSVIVQGGLMGPLTRRFRENWLIITGLWLMTASLIAWAFATSLGLLVVVLFPLSLAGGVLNTVIQSAISKSVTRDEVGGMLGIAASLESATRVIGPIVGGFLLQNLGLWSPGIFTALLLVWTVVFTYRRIILPAKHNQIEISP